VILSIGMTLSACGGDHSGQRTTAHLLYEGLNSVWYFYRKCAVVSRYAVTSEDNLTLKVDGARERNSAPVIAVDI